jgi:hypothetical protein
MSQYQASSSSNVDYRSRHRAASPVDLLGSSPEFGDFVDSGPRAQDDLLLDQASIHVQQYRHRPVDSRPLIDLMSDEPFPEKAWHADDANGSLHIQLPPRPSEITPDYNPPIRSPRRLSDFAFSGPGSPPQVSDIVFHATPKSNPHRNPSGNAQSKLINTLATTSKLASKWKSAIDHIPSGQATSSFTTPTPTAKPIDISHTTPFVSRDRGSGSYIPPSGAPGFVPEDPSPQEPQQNDRDFADTLLIGRRGTTEPVLSTHIADKVRP